MIIYTVGVGTPEGEVLQVTDESGARTFVKDDAGNVVKSRLNEKLLTDIAVAANELVDDLLAHGSAELVPALPVHAPEGFVRFDQLPAESPRAVGLGETRGEVGDVAVVGLHAPGQARRRRQLGGRGRGGSGDGQDAR